MSTYVPASLRKQIIERADDRCEYCRIPQRTVLFACEHELAFEQSRDTAGIPDSDGRWLLPLPQWFRITGSRKALRAWLRLPPHWSMATIFQRFAIHLFGRCLCRLLDVVGWVAGFHTPSKSRHSRWRIADKRAVRLIREHRSTIEHGLHWVKDVV